MVKPWELVEGIIYHGSHPIVPHGWRVSFRVSGRGGPARCKGEHDGLACAGELHQEAGSFRKVVSDEAVMGGQTWDKLLSVRLVGGHHTAPAFSHVSNERHGGFQAVAMPSGGRGRTQFRFRSQ